MLRPPAAWERIGVQQGHKNAEADQSHLTGEGNHDRVRSDGSARIRNENMLEHGDPPSGCGACFSVAASIDTGGSY
jgi:hypothetical protein